MLLELAGTAADLLSGLQSALGLKGDTAVAILQIIGIDILLSGDNAVVIALACRTLPEHQRKMGIGLGVIAAVVLRLIFAVVLQALMNLPWLSLIGAVFLLVIAVQLATEGDQGGKEVVPAKSLFGAVWTIAIADLVMSLDNVLAIAGAAQGNPWLIVFGLALSVPLIIGGAALITGLLTRYPILVWAGAGLLGWVAGEMIAREPVLEPALATWSTDAGLSPNTTLAIFGALGAVAVVAAGLAIVGLRRKH